MNEIKLIKRLFEKHKNEENAFHMEKYMRNKFLFLGIKTPLRKELMREFFKESQIKKIEFQPHFVRELWELDEREYQYAAMDYLHASLKKLHKNDLPLMEKLITTKSWWDTVDMLAQKQVGKIAKDFPEVIPETIEKWNVSDNLWLRRSAILFQLKYKVETDEDLLYRYIINNSESEDFFIQKAIGWVLREYSKTNPQSVREFIANHKLSKLSVREGSKYL